MMKEKLERFLRKVKKAGSGKYESYGTRRHCFQLNDPLPEEDVAAFEKAQGVILPAEYRLFLTEAGDGGAGPYNGISPLKTWDMWLEEESQEEGFLSSPCPLIYEKAIRDDWASLVPPYWDEWCRGTICISDMGCTYTARLIVSGESRGRVVYVDANGTRIRPYFVRDLTFLDWCERWVDKIFAREEIGWFGVDNPDYKKPYWPA